MSFYESQEKFKQYLIIQMMYYSVYFKTIWWGFPGGAVVKSLPANAGDTGLRPGPGRSHMPQSN